MPQEVDASQVKNFLERHGLAKLFSELYGCNPFKGYRAVEVGSTRISATITRRGIVFHVERGRLI